MIRMTKAEKAIENQAIEEQVIAALKIHADRVMFNVIDVGSVLNAGRAAARAGESVEDAMIATIENFENFS